MVEQNDISEKIPDIALRAEAFLFSEGGPITIKKLSQLLGTDLQGAKAALMVVKENLQSGSIELIQSESEASLAISSYVSSSIEHAYERELGRDIGESGLEVLAILLYCGACTKARIDYIRGVNTSSTIRTLLSRGLIERTGNPHDAREYLYRPTLELLAYLGVSDAKNLPDYAKISTDLASFRAEQGPFQDSHGTDTDTRADA